LVVGWGRCGRRHGRLLARRSWFCCSNSGRNAYVGRRRQFQSNLKSFFRNYYDGDRQRRNGGKGKETIWNSKKDQIKNG
jgi:hypothetical protein